MLAGVASTYMNWSDISTFCRARGGRGLALGISANSFYDPSPTMGAGRVSPVQCATHVLPQTDIGESYYGTMSL